MFNDRIPYNSTILSQVTRHSVGVLEKALKIFKDLDLIEIMDNGAIFLLDIQNYIGRSTTEADRQRDYQNRIKQEKVEKQDNLLIECKKSNMKSNMKSNRKSTPEIELEKEIEIELEIEKEIEIDLQKKAEKKKIKKEKYSDYVTLLKTEYESLIERFGEAGTKDKIENLNMYKGSTGKKYASDYLTILNWERKETKKTSEKGSGNIFFDLLEEEDGHSGNKDYIRNLEM